MFHQLRHPSLWETQPQTTLKIQMLGTRMESKPRISLLSLGFVTKPSSLTDPRTPQRGRFYYQNTNFNLQEFPKFPIGGRLSLFAHHWGELTTIGGCWVLEIVNQGLLIEFSRQPSISTKIIETHLPMGEKSDFLGYRNSKPAVKESNRDSSCFSEISNRGILRQSLFSSKTLRRLPDDTKS